MQQLRNTDPFSGRSEAIRNLGGAENLYFKYVERFQSHYCDCMSRLSSYLEAMQYEDAHMLVHSIKGLASTLGMLDLRQQAEALEHGLKEGRYNDLPPLITSFGAALRQVVQSSYPQSSSSVGT